MELEVADAGTEYTLEGFLLLSELLLTIFYQAQEYIEGGYTSQRKKVIIERMVEIQSNINYVLEKLNYEAYLKDEFVFIAPKDMVVDEAIECVDDENIALELLHYNHRQLLGDLQGKRKILTQLGSYLEPVLNSKQLSSNGYRSLESDIGFYLNNLNIRHNNLEGAKRQSCCVEIHQKGELEVWYDKAYRAMVMAIISKTQIDNHNQLEQLKRSNGM